MVAPDLTHRGGQGQLRAEELEVLHRQDRRGERLITQLLTAQPDRVPEMTLAQMTSAVRLYTWLLDRVGAAGVRLSAAGYLPPVVVQETVRRRAEEDEWIGTYNREPDLRYARLGFAELPVRLS